jgi:hypothetical protein
VPIFKCKIFPKNAFFENAFFPFWDPRTLFGRVAKWSREVLSRGFKGPSTSGDRDLSENVLGAVPSRTWDLSEGLF